MRNIQVKQSNQGLTKQSSGKAFNKLSSAEYLRVLKLLVEHFPKTFSITNPKPLKLKIHKDIKARIDISYNLLKHFLRRYCRSKGYKATLVTGAYRYDLDGNICTQVLQEEVPKPLTKNTYNKSQKFKIKTSQAANQ